MVVGEGWRGGGEGVVGGGGGGGVGEGWSGGGGLWGMVGKCTRSFTLNRNYFLLLHFYCSFLPTTFF